MVMEGEFYFSVRVMVYAGLISLVLFYVFGYFGFLGIEYMLLCLLSGIVLGSVIAGYVSEKTDKYVACACLIFVLITIISQSELRSFFLMVLPWILAGMLSMFSNYANIQNI